MSASPFARRPEAAPSVGVPRSRKAQSRSDREEQEVAARFSVLRTRLLQEMSRRRWRRLGVCPITDGAGATYVAANLALAASRLPNCDVILVDLALGHPSLAAQMGIPGDFRFISYLRGEDLNPDDFTARIEGERNLRCFTSGRAIPAGAELLQDETARERIDRLVTESSCDLAIFDLSPVLGTDEGLAGLPAMDAVLLVADGRNGTGRQITDCERLMANMPPLLGVVLNKAEMVR